MAFVEQWKHFLLKQGKADAGRYVADLPFSFKCGERSSREWIKIDTANIKSTDWQADQTRTHTLTWKDDKTSLTCEMKLTEFRGFPAFQWVVNIRNDGKGDSAKVHDFWGIDTYWHAPDGVMPVLHRSVGSPGHEDDYQFRSEFMHNSMWEKKRRIAMDSPANVAWAQANSYLIPRDKRSSGVWLPFFNYQTGGDGLDHRTRLERRMASLFRPSRGGKNDDPGRSRELRFHPSSRRDGPLDVESRPLLERRVVARSKYVP